MQNKLTHSFRVKTYKYLPPQLHSVHFKTVLGAALISNGTFFADSVFVSSSVSQPDLK